MALFFRRQAQSGFRTRSPDRDRATDRARFDDIRETLDRVRTDAERERKALGARLRSATDAASQLVGTEPFEYLERDTQAEQALVAAEAELAAASARMRGLDAFLSKLDRIQELVELARTEDDVGLGHQRSAAGGGAAASHESSGRPG